MQRDGLICVGKDLRREGFARAAKCFDQGDLAGNVVPHIAGGKARTSIAPMASARYNLPRLEKAGCLVVVVGPANGLYDDGLI